MKKNSDIVEVHNRPNYIKNLISLKSKLILYFHNDPLTMDGSSKTKRERIFLINICEKIIFNSEWSKKQFLKKLPQFYHKSKKINCYTSIN